MNRLHVEGLFAGYGAVTVLRDVAIEVRQGELVALLGMNGNGKSTLLNSILGFVRPGAGRVILEWDGETIELAGRAPHEIVGLGIGYVPEGRRLAPNLTVEENLLLAGSSNRAKAGRKANLELCYETFSILKERRRQPASTLSGGQQQMLAIARALMTAPKLIVVDEPSVGLAPIMVEQVIATIRRLQEQTGLTILMAEQSFFQAIEVASRAYILSHGRIIRVFDQKLDPAGQEEIRSAMMGAV
ncbi:ABC transporter ATP-binding protein [Chelativorans salis]|uniref:ABC transporter ATP-binding protein n=1 Tax=Chelativorans salis TaxID=2978478 RepID=A0ABT2LJC9_9HYPH|nr:ABC transporter ATP-binding protein [Chelativorans sp. EGI FJ00035]MCT7374603.1 ABC transporter ATP-binding protein [Chelativorans sp. EGI FJ00035]